MDLNEDGPPEFDHNQTSDEEIEEGDSDDFIDVLAVFDGKGEPYDADDSAQAKSTPKEPPIMDEGSESEEEVGAEQGFEMDDEEDEDDEEENESESEEDEALAIEASDDDADESPEALASLENFISTLDPSKKRKAPLDADTADAETLRPHKRRIMKERNEAGAENEFSAQANGKYC